MKIGQGLRESGHCAGVITQVRVDYMLSDFFFIPNTPTYIKKYVTDIKNTHNLL